MNAVDGYSAITQAQKEKPDLIILDIGLPAGDGFVVLDRLQRNPELASIPVIVLTARDPQSTERAAMEKGACAFFQKPADNGALLGRDPRKAGARRRESKSHALSARISDRHHFLAEWIVP